MMNTCSSLLSAKCLWRQGRLLLQSWEKYNNNQSNLSDFIQPGPYNKGVSLTQEVPVNVGRKMAPKTLVVETNAASHRAVTTKRFKIG
jgi:hypothetical protein